MLTDLTGSDLNHNNQYIVGLALCTLGNIASVEMARDLFPEVETIVSSSNPYVRRKAALCAMRICRKVPDLQEHFLEKTKLLLNDRNHGVLLSGLTLAIGLCEADEEEGGEEGVVDVFKPLTGNLVKVLKGLSQSGYAPEHDVTGVSDPFLQVKILRLLRVLGRGDTQISEQINDILAQVATNTEASRNVGNAILYEAVLTILDIEADSGLRVLGVNILGKFLTNKDNNIRYVALNTLIKVVAIEPNAVQRHRNTILDCLRDPDISIRRRALDLSFTLINDSNVRVLIRELLAFLEVADNEFKPIMTSQIGIAADRFAPTKRWHVDTMLRVLTLAGNYVKEQILSSFVRLIATTPDLQTYCAQKLYAALQEDISQEGLNLAGAWVIGEYGDALLRGGSSEAEELAGEVREKDVVNLFATILGSSFAGQSVVQYIITSTMKLTTRLQEPAQIERLRRLLQNHQTDLDIEVQQRSVEYSNLFGYDQIRRGVLERMPPPEIKEEQRVLGEATGASKKRNSRLLAKKKPAQITEQDMLLDLMGDDTGGASLPFHGGQPSSKNADLLADILGGGEPAPLSHANGAKQAPAPSAVGSIMDLFDAQPAPASSIATASSTGILSGLSSPSAAAAPPAAPAHTAFRQADLHVSLVVSRTPQAIGVQARFQNTSAVARLSQVNLQAAVPKSQKLSLQAISNAAIEPGRGATQGLRVVGVNGVSFLWPHGVPPGNLCALRACVRGTDVVDRFHLAPAPATAAAAENHLRQGRRRRRDGAGGLVGAELRPALPRRQEVRDRTVVVCISGCILPGGDACQGPLVTFSLRPQLVFAPTWPSVPSRILLRRRRRCRSRPRPRALVPIHQPAILHQHPIPRAILDAPEQPQRHYPARITLTEHHPVRAPPQRQSRRQRPPHVQKHQHRRRRPHPRHHRRRRHRRRRRRRRRRRLRAPAEPGRQPARKVHVRATHGPQAAGGANARPRGARGAVHGKGGGVGGGDGGGEGRGAGSEGEAVALGGADGPAGGVVDGGDGGGVGVGGVGVGVGGAAAQGEALLVVLGDDGEDLGGCHVQGAQVPVGQDVGEVGVAGGGEGEVFGGGAVAEEPGEFPGDLRVAAAAGHGE